MLLFIIFVNLSIIIPNIYGTQSSSIQVCLSNQMDDFAQGCQGCKDTSCLQCNNYQCLDCNISWSKESVNKCITLENCGEGYFLNSANRVCQACEIPACIRCSDQETCSQCQDGYELNQKTKRCLLSLFNDETQLEKYNQIKSILNQQNEVKLDYYCPSKYTEYESDRICKKLQQCEVEQSIKEFYFRDSIIQLVIFEPTQLLISASKKVIAIYDRQDLKKATKIFDVDFDNKNQFQSEEQIHNMILFYNILNIFTSHHIYSFDLIKNQYVFKMDFRQGEYEFEIENRFQLDENQRVLKYLYLEVTQKIVCFQQLLIQYELNQNLIKGSTFNLKKDWGIQINLLDTDYFSLGYIPLQNIIFISTIQQYYSILVKEIISDQIFNVYQNNEKNFKKYILITNHSLDYPFAYDLLKQDSQGSIYIFRASNLEYYIEKIRIDEQKLSFDIVSSIIHKDNSFIFTTIQLFNSHFSTKFGEVISIQIQQENQLFTQTFKLILRSYDLSLQQEFLIKGMTREQNEIISQVGLIDDAKTGLISVLLVMSQNLFILEFDQEQFILRFTLTFKNLPKIDFSIIIVQSFEVEVNNQKSIQQDLIIPEYTIIYCIQRFKQQYKQIQTQQVYLERYSDLFSLSKIKSNELLVAYDNLTETIFLIEYKKTIKSIQILKINSEYNQVEVFAYFQLRQECNLPCLKYLQANSLANQLILITQQESYYLNFHSLTIEETYSQSYVYDLKYPYLLIGNIQKQTQLIQIMNDKKFKSILMTNIQNTIQSSNSMIISFHKQKSILLIFQQIYSENLQFYVLLDGQLIFEKKISNIKKVEFQDEKFFYMVLIGKNNDFEILFYEVDLENRSLLKRDSRLVRVENNIDHSNILFIRQGSQRLVLIFSVNYEEPNQNSLQIFNLIDFTLLQTISVHHSLCKINNLSSKYDSIWFNQKAQNLNIVCVQDQSPVKNLTAIQYNAQLNRFEENGYSFQYILNFDELIYEQQGIFSTASHSKQSALLTVFNINLFSLKLIHYELSTATEFKIIYQKNQAYMSDGRNGMIINNLPNQQNSLLFQLKGDLINYWIYSTYGILITTSLKENDYYTVVQMLYIDNLQPVCSELEFAPPNQVFWFNAYETLIVVSSSLIKHYKMNNNQLQLIHSIQASGITYYCFQAEENPLVICDQLGIYNFEIRQFAYDTNVFINILRDFVFQENRRFIIFESENNQNSNSNYIYDIKLNILKVFDIQLNSQSIPLSAISINNFSDDQGLYHERGKCIIFNILSFQIIIDFSQNLSSDATVCLLGREIDHFFYYNNGSFTVYRFPLLNKENPQIIYIKQIQSHEQKFMNIYTKYYGNKIIGQSMEALSRNEFYRNFLIINSENGDIMNIKGFTTSTLYSQIQMIWEEKNILITNEGLISIGEQQLVLSFQGQLNDQKYSSQICKRFNYIIFTTSQNKNGIQILDISDVFPFNSENSLPAIRYSISPINMCHDYFLNFLQSQFLNQEEQILEIISFDLNTLFLKKHTISVNRNNDLKASIKQKNIKDLSSYFFEGSSNPISNLSIKNNYKIYQILSIQNEAFTLLIYNCQMIIINEKGEQIKNLHLEEYQCIIFSSTNIYNPSSSSLNFFNSKQENLNLNRFYLIKDYTRIYQLKLDNNKSYLLEIFSTQNSDYKIKSIINFYSSSDQIFFQCILYFNPKNILSIQYQESIIKDISLAGSQEISSIELFNWNLKTYLSIGTDSDFIIYNLISISSNDFDIKQVYSFQLGIRGQSKMFFHHVINSQANQKLLFIGLSSKRLMIFESDQGQLNQISIQLKRENLIHSRSQIKMKVLDEVNMIAILSQLQITFYSYPSLQYIATIEEENIQFIQDVNALPYLNTLTIIVCENQQILIYDIKRVNKNKRLILQRSYQYQIPQIYQIFHSSQIMTTSKTTYNIIIINGHSLSGTFSLTYKPDSKIINGEDKHESLSYSPCLMDIDIPRYSIQQEIVYSELLSKHLKDFNDGDIDIYIQLKESQDLFLPLNLINFGNSARTKFNLHINLNSYKGIISSYSFNQYSSYVKSVKIFNGILGLKDNIKIFQLQELILENLSFDFSKEGFTLSIQTAQFVVFNKIIIQQQNIENMKRQNDFNLSKSFQLNSLIEFYQISHLIIKNLQLSSLKIQQDLFNFNMVDKTTIEQLRLTNSQILGTLLYFQKNNKNVLISQLLIQETSVVQVLSIYSSENVSLKNAKFLSVKNINSQFVSHDNQILKQQRIIEGSQQPSNQYTSTSFILIRFTLKRIDISQILINQQCELNTFFDYSNTFLQGDLNELVQNSQLTMKNIYVDNSIFQNYLFKIEQYLTNLSEIHVKNSQNPQIKIDLSVSRLNMNNFSFQNNRFLNRQILILSNSVIRISNFIIQDNQILSTSKKVTIQYLYAINIERCSFYICNLNAKNNTVAQQFIRISGEHDFLDAFKNNITVELLREKTNLIHNLNIHKTNKGAFLIENLQNIHIISSSFFQNNYEKLTKNGGALQIMNTLLCQISKTHIKNNFALLYGGGIYLEDSDISITESSISQNYALIGGGIRYISSFQMSNLLSSNRYEQVFDNYADIFGKNIGSVPYKINILSNFRNVTSSINQFSTSFIFQVYDEEGALIDYNFSEIKLNGLSKDSKLELLKYSQFELSPLTSGVQIDKQFSSYDPLKKYFNLTCFLANSGYQEILQLISGFKGNQFHEINEKQLQLSIPLKNSLKFDLTVSFRECNFGELLQKVSHNNYQCYLCQDNTYSVSNPYQNQETQRCKQCPYGTVFCSGSRISPQEEFWIDPGSDYVSHCYNMPSKCTQKYQNKQLSEVDSNKNRDKFNGCSEGGYGPLCQSCDYLNEYWGEQQGIVYAKKNRYECINCDNKKDFIKKYLLPTIMILLILIYITYILFYNTIRSITNLNAILMKKMGMLIISNTLNQSLKVTSIFKIVISYIQIISVATQFKLQIPYEIQSLLFFFGDILEISFYILDCIFVRTGLALKIKIIFLRLIWTLVSPLFYSLILLIIGYFISKSKKISSRKRNLMKTGLLQLYYMIYTGLVSQTIGTISCQIINGKSYILLDTHFECYDTQYYLFNSLISIPILLFTIILPIFIFTRLRKNKSTLLNVNIYLNYGFFYFEYKEEKYYWELWKIYQKIFIYSCAGIFSQQSILTGMIVSLAIIMYIKFQLKEQPYKLNFLNQIDYLSQITALITIFGIIVNGQSNSNILQYIFLFVIVVVNISFFAKALFYLLLNPKCRQSVAYLFQFGFFRNKGVRQSFITQTKTINLFRMTKHWKLIKQFIRHQRYYRPTLQHIKDNSIDLQLQKKEFNTPPHRDVYQTNPTKLKLKSVKFLKFSKIQTETVINVSCAEIKDEEIQLDKNQIKPDNFDQFNKNPFRIEQL